MMELNYGGERFELASNPNEITVRQLQSIMNVFGVESEFYFESWLKIIEILSCDKLANLIDVDTFYKVLRNLNITNIDKDSFESTFECKDRKFVANTKDDGELLITAREMSRIEKLVKKHPNNWIPKAMAIIFKEDGVTDTDSNINKRAAILADKMTANIALPLLVKVNIKLVTNIERLKTMYEKA